MPTKMPHTSSSKMYSTLSFAIKLLSSYYRMPEHLNLRKWLRDRLSSLADTPLGTTEWWEKLKETRTEASLKDNSLSRKAWISHNIWKLISRRTIRAHLTKLDPKMPETVWYKAWKGTAGIVWNVAFLFTLSVRLIIGFFFFVCVCFIFAYVVTVAVW